MPIDYQVDDLAIWRMLEDHPASEPVVDASLVVAPGGTTLGGMSIDEINLAVSHLVGSFAVSGGGQDYATVLTATRAIEAAGSTTDSAPAFRRALARAGLAHCLVCLAHSRGLLKQGGGYVLLPSIVEVADDKGKLPPTPTHGESLAAAAMQEEVSTGVRPWRSSSWPCTVILN